MHSKRFLVIFSVLGVFHGLYSCTLTCTCDGDSNAYCASRSLTEVPKDIPPTTSTLSLKRNEIFAIPSQTFLGLHALVYLDISDNELQELGEDAFTGLKNLTALYLHGNKLSRLPTRVFSDLANLNKLRLNDNELTSLPPLRDLKGLTYLNLAGNNITSVGAFPNLPELAHVVLSRNRIARLSNDAFLGIRNVKKVYLSDNELGDDSLPAYDVLRNLVELFLDLNKLTRFVAFDFARLRELSLASNLISHLPATVFDDFSSLRQLKLQNNRIASLTESQFAGLSKLERLYLDNNILEQPPNISALNQLEELSLSHNRIEDVPTDHFNVVSQISILDLSHNRIRTIPSFYVSLFRSGYRYTRIRIHLGGNRITRVGDYAFQGVPPSFYLVLTLDNMAVEAVDEHSFDGLYFSHYYIDLRGNRLTTLPEKLHFAFVRRGYLHLDDNPWSCDCRLKGFRRWAEEKSQQVYVSGFTCHVPQSLAGVHVPDIAQENLTCSRPEIDDPIVWMSVNEGDGVVLGCNATGLPRPDVYWVAPRGHRIGQTANSASGSAEWSVIPGDGTLVKTSAAAGDSGTYVCVAENLEGTVVASRHLAVTATEDASVKNQISEENRLYSDF